MATRYSARESEGKKPTARKASVKKGAASNEAAANGPAASARATPPPKAGKRLPTATIGAPKVREAGELNAEAGEVASCTRPHIPNARTRKALRDADAGKNLTRHADADDLFKKLGIKLGQEKA